MNTRCYNHPLSGLFFLLLWAGFTPLFAQTGDGQVTIEVKNESAVNTDGLEFSPTFYEDGIVLISTNNAGLKKLKDEKLKMSAMSILRSRRDSSGALGKPEPFARELSSLFHEGPVCFDRTAETIYFSRNVLIGGKEKLSKDGEHKMRLYSSKKSGEGWTEPIPLPFNTNEFDDCHPAISIDGDKLFFASNRPGGFGKMDLYVVYKVGESWSEPVNLGPSVNTKENEVFPFVHADNTLYYASNRKEGIGGLDLFYTTSEDNEWSKPISLGEPFNTKGDDFGLIVDLDKINGYYSSNGAGGIGGDEVFSFHTDNGNLDDYLLQNKLAPVRDLDIRIIVVDKNTGQAIPDAGVRIQGAEADNAIGRDESGNLITIQKINGQDVMKAMPPDKGVEGNTDNNGRFAAVLRNGRYIVSIRKQGYDMKQTPFTLHKTGSELTIQLDRGSYAGKAHWNAGLFNYASNTPLAGAMVVVTNKATNKRDTVYADGNGLVDHYLDPNAKYEVAMYQGGRMVGSSDINTQGWSTNGMIHSQNFAVAPMLPGSVIELPNIYYNFNDATLRPDARKDLDLVLALLQQQPNLTIELASHTDSRGSSYYNQELSQRRANGVVDYLVSRNVSRKRLRPVGYGESEPRNKCVDGLPCTEEEHARNRRTEVRIIAGMTGSSFTYVDGNVGLGNGSDNPEPQSPYINTPPPTPIKEPVKYSNPGSGAFFVVAGSFLAEERAQNQLVILRGAGFSTAEIVRFSKSNFFSVCVGRFNSRKDAQVLEEKLESSNIDAFVRVGN